MPLRCVYTDLDGTLLGPRGALFRDSEGNFSLRQARALEACHRAGVEVVIMSGRREDTVRSDARLIGQRSYIYEAGCGVVIEGERTYLTGDWQPGDDGTPAERLIASGIPELLFERFPGRLEWHTPWHTGRELSLLMRGQGRRRRRRTSSCASAATTTCGSSTTARSAGRWRESRAPPTPTTWSRGARARPRGSPSTSAPGAMRREECIAVGDSIEDLETAELRRPLLLRRQRARARRGAARGAVGFDNVTVTEGGRWATASTRPWSRPSRCAEGGAH